MKAIIIASVLVLTPTQLQADQSVRGYLRQDGIYVAPYIRSTPNSIKFDNYSSRGNYNPYTGKRGYTDAYSLPYRSRYSTDRSLQW